MIRSTNYLLFFVISLAVLSGAVFLIRNQVLRNTEPSLQTSFGGEVFEFQKEGVALATGASITGDPQFSDDGRRALFLVTQEKELAGLHLWEQGSGLTELAKDIASARFSLSGNGTAAAFFVAGKAGTQVRLWEEGFGVQDFAKGEFQGVWYAALSQYGERLVLTPQDSKASFDGDIAGEDYVPGSLIFFEFAVPEEFKRLRSRPPSKRGVKSVLQALVGAATEATLTASEVVVLNTDGKTQEVKHGRFAKRAVPNDVDRDGAADLLVFERGEELPFWRAHTTSGFEGATAQVSGVSAERATWRVGDNVGVPIPGDYNGDGVIDLATFTPGLHVSRYASKENWQIFLSESRDLTDRQLIEPGARYQNYHWGVGAARAVPADYDGDGATDIAILQPETFVWHIAYSGAGFNAAKASLVTKGFGDRIQFGKPGDIPIPADYDGDGRTDLGVYREPSETEKSGLWKVLIRSSSKNVEKEYRFGRAGDIPISADFDCDGRSDLMMYRPANKTWYLYQDDNTSKPFAVWGLEGAEPLAADYDGDGCADMAFFRAVGNPNWMILPSRFKETARERIPAGRNVVLQYSWGSESALPVELLLRQHQRGELE